jgi:GH25 family lysozyme M1 (1,4-beta-N-acetylmuramidase)
MSLSSTSLFMTRRAGLAIGAALLTAALAVADPPAARADALPPGATGYHDGMMPPTSPDARAGAASPVAASASGSRVREAPSAARPWSGTGVDVARYQHPYGAPIRWSRVAASGQDIAIVKATEVYAGRSGPVLYTNPYLQADLSGAHAAGLTVGAYAFAHPEFSATAQADDFAAAIGHLPNPSLPPVLDLETTGGLTVPELQAWTKAFLVRLQHDTGVVPMIYTGPGFWNSHMGGTTAFAHYPLWEAHWTSADAPAPFGGWSSYTLWQYTNTAVVPGITGYVDQSRIH